MTEIMDRSVPGKHWGAVVCAVTILGLLTFYLSAVLFQVQSPLSIDTSSTDGTCHNPPFHFFPNSFNGSEPGQDLVRSLIDQLKERTRIAAGGRVVNATEEALELEEWRIRNPCQSRVELASLYSLRKSAKDLPLNPLWEEVFRVYSTYHRTCMRAVGDVTDYFNQRNTSTGCQFVIADTSHVGLGNKLQVVANAVMYGIITGRVILLPTSHLVTEYTCEPFEGSSWELDSSTFPTPPERNRKQWKLSQDVLSGIDKYKSSCHIGHDAPSAELPYAAGDTHKMKQPYQRFYCSTEQSFYSEITWVYLSGCIYTIPKIFAVPTFRPTMEALFPDRVVLTRLFRSVLLPADSVWSRVRRVYDAYLQPGDRLVGIQMRYLKGSKQFTKLHELIDERVVDCVVSRNLLPDVDRSPNPTSSPGISTTNSSSSGSASRERITVFVTSLYESLHERMSKMYMFYPTLSGDTVDVIQITHEEKQDYGVDIDIQAFTEVLLLSLSDDLILAPVSTFGGSAQAYGGLTPWFIEYRQKAEWLPVCQRGLTVEVCNQYTGKNYDCKYDRELGNRPFSEVVPSIQDCPQIEFPYLSENEQGVQLRTSFLS